jgi:hypothetical protein
MTETTLTAQAEALANIKRIAQELQGAINSALPEKPTYWNGTPDSARWFPMGTNGFVNLWASLSELVNAISVTLPDEEDDEEEEF